MKVGVVMGSTSDLEVMTPAIETLQQFGIEVDKRVISAHRAPHELMRWAESARERGLSIIIAGAGGDTKAKTEIIDDFPVFNIGVA